MVHQRSSCTWRRFLLFLAYGAAQLACAGSDTPPLEAGGRERISELYGSGRGRATADPGDAVAGSSMNAPTGGRGNAQQAGDGGAAASAGSMPNADAGTAGGGGSVVCDGFAVLETSCGGSPVCHGAGSAVSSFAESAAAAATFVGKKAQGSACAAQSVSIFDPEDAESSLVITKMGTSPPCGVPMPYGSPAGSMPPADVACVTEWIESL